jgi:hypothetical protein
MMTLESRRVHRSGEICLVFWLRSLAPLLSVVVESSGTPARQLADARLTDGPL